MDHWPNEAIILFIISLFVSAFSIVSCGAVLGAGQEAQNNLRESERALARAESRLSFFDQAKNWASMPCSMECKCRGAN